MNLIWSKEASNSLTEIYEYIFEDSPQNAVKVVDGIIELVEKLKDKRVEYSIDPIINKQKFRHVSIWNYKIIYERNEESVIVLDVFDGRKNPKRLHKY